MEVSLKNIDTEEKNIDNVEPAEQPTEEAEQEQQKIIISSVEKKRQNKLYKCEYCNKELSKKAYYYTHNCLLKKQANQQKQEPPPPPEPIKQIEQPKIYTQPVPEPIIKEVIKEIEPTITDEHIKNYIQKQNKEKEQARRNIHGDKMRRLFSMAM